MSANNSSGVADESLKYLTTEERLIFTIAFSTILTVALLGNVSAIYATAQRKHRYIQKTCIISLAVSDIVMVTSSSINYLETFSHPLVNWTLGELMCSIIPTCQILGVTASSASLVAIALDRYRNVVHALSKRWNPGLLYCLLGTTIGWLACAGISYPMWFLYDHRSLNVVFMNGSTPLYMETLAVCIALRKNELMIYSICVSLAIFLPLVILFFWLYYHIAELIWKHRKPLSTLFHKKNDNSTETSTSQVKSSESASSNSVHAHLQRMTRRNKNMHVERKIRTFKIIVVLMLVFLLCRFPYHIFSIMKIVNNSYNEHKHWIITYVLNGLVLLNCALNPFLYTFLNPTLNVLLKLHKIFIQDFFCKVCCCCCTNAEFEEFEKENPFIVENFEQRKVSNPRNDTLKSTQRNSRVKFEEHPQVQVYMQEEGGQEKRI